MQTSTAVSHFWEIDRAAWHKALWWAVVALTLGLCLLAWKRPVVDDGVAHAQPVTVSVTAQQQPVVPIKMVVKVRQFHHLPVWASALAEADLMHEEYPQPSLSQAA